MSRSRVLIAEDESLIAEELQDRLRGMGIIVTGVVASGEDAITRTEQTSPDLVLMDIRLKGSMDGIEAAAVIRDQCDVPVLYLTAHSDDATTDRAKLTAPVGYLLKPFQERELRLAVEMALYRRETQRRVRDTEILLRTAEKMDAVGQLAGGVAHEINNLMTTVIGASSLLLASCEPDDPTRDLLEAIRQAGDRAAVITRELLAFSRRQISVPVVMNLNTTIRGMEAVVRDLVGETVELTIRLTPDLSRVKTDPTQMEQVILNLVKNARDAMPCGGKLTLETRNVRLDQSFAQTHAGVRPGNHILLSVTDNGCGMDAHAKAHLFEPFFTTKEVGKGAGLGLASVWGIVKECGGQVYVFSEPGRGTRFETYLPEALELAPEDPETALLTHGSETVMLVDDDDGVRKLTRLVLEMHGYTVLEATDGADALQLCQRDARPIDLLLTDVVMPNMGGSTLAQRLVSLRPKLRVLFMSGHTEHSIFRHGVLTVEKAFIQKPFAPNDLTRKVRQVLDQPSPAETV